MGDISDREVSVVVPTIGRASLRAAVESALGQTTSVKEVIVAADTLDDLDLPVDPRVRVLRVGPRAGGNVARQTAVAAAEGSLIAFLDDDDVWLPEKLSVQLALAGEVGHDRWIVASRVVDTDGSVRPSRVIRPAEDLVEYLFRQSLRHGVGKLHTSTLLISRDLLLEVPLDQDLRFHQDTDWLVRVSRTLPAGSVRQAPEALVVTHPTPGSVANSIKWRGSAEWALKTFSSSQRRELGEFLLGVTMRHALRDEGRRGGLACLRVAVTRGRPSPLAVSLAGIRPARGR